MITGHDNYAEAALPGAATVYATGVLSNGPGQQSPRVVVEVAGFKRLADQGRFERITLKINGTTVLRIEWRVSEWARAALAVWMRWFHG